MAPHLSPTAIAARSSPVNARRCRGGSSDSSPPAAIARTGRGFVYLISRLGVTGERTDLPTELPATVARLRGATTLPVCVGFGISRPEQARAVAALADGVVVGSAIVRAADESVDAALRLAASLRSAIDDV